MNTSKIEEIAVAAIKNEILRSDYLANEIPVNDKTPSWDGEIWVYDNSRQTKDTLFGKVPVQVKGRKVLKINKDVKFSIGKADLENYYNNGGVIFFVVEIVSIEQTQIFYLDLLPIDLKRILIDLGDKKSVTQTFKKLGTENRALEFICRNFIFHSRQQGLSLLIDKEINYDNIKIKVFTPSSVDITNYLLDNEAYAYGHIESLNLDIPLYKMHIKEIAEEAELWVGTNDEKRYTEIVRIIKKNTVSLKFGYGFEMILPKDFAGGQESNDEFKINFNEKGPIQDRIRDLKFMLEIISTKSININGSIIQLNKYEGDSRFKGLSSYLQKLEDIVETFNRLNIDFNEDLNSLTKNDWNTINALVQIVLHKNYKPIKSNKENPFLHFRVANLKVVLFTTQVKSEKIVFNLFNFEALKQYLRIQVILEDGTERVEHSPFLLFDPLYLLEISNFDYNVVEASFKSMEYKSNLSSVLANDYMLKILNYYDNHTNRREILNLTFNIFCYLEKANSDSIIYFLNKMQVIRRMRDFTPREKEILIERKLQNTHITDIMCALSILSDSKIEFEVYFDKLSKEDQEKFYTYPIYNLAKLWYLK
ncbi:hypothetical protein [Bacillus tuaregi]|uniref:hypothetical protein n=1 Tax=Bacillus tuaregi TaxID=1816695 RepID=UPI0008F8DF89|nr:hypothetical protein [Bacillus tuaregi]